MEAGLSAVVINYRTAGDLHVFLRSFAQYPPTTPWSLAVVNVDPRDEDREVAERWVQDRPGASLETHETNTGYAVAANAAHLGDYDVCAVFNADIELTEGALDDCADALRDNPDWGVLGPRQRNSAHALTHGGIFGPPERPRHRNWLGQLSEETADIRPDALSVSGAAMFVRRSLWDDLTACPLYQKVAPGAKGPWLPVRRIFYEDMWLSRHARAHGHNVVFWGQTTIRHEFHQSVRANGVHAATVMEESLGYYRQACAAHGLVSE